MKYRTLAAALLLGSVMFTSCVDEFSELNSDPSTITKPDIRFLFTKCEASFQPGDYAQWFGGFNDLSTWSQTTVSSGGNTTRSNRPTDEANGCGYEVNEVLRYANEIRYQISLLPEEEKATYEYIQYLCNPLLVYLSIQDADLYGSRQYTEAEQARYTNPPLLLPKYDTQEELLEVWLKELDQTINYLSRTQAGWTESSLQYRDPEHGGMTWTSQYADSKGIQYTDGMIPEGVFKEGTIATLVDGTKMDVSGLSYAQLVQEGKLEPTHAGSWYGNNYAWGAQTIDDIWVHKLSYIALRNITVNYRLPNSISHKLGAKGLNLSFSARNLGYLYNSLPNNLNPESVRSNSASEFRIRGFEPYTASYIFTINANF